MEFCEGGSLKSHLNDQPPFLVTDLHDFSKQILSAMVYLEENMIVHRDLSARNILIDRRKKVRKIKPNFGQIFGSRSLFTEIGSETRSRFRDLTCA